MADCKYCGKSAGLFRSIHKVCAAQRDRARCDIDLAFQNMMLIERPPTPATFRAIVEKLGDEGRLTTVELRSKVLSGLGIALDAALSDLDLSHNEMDRLNSMVEAFDLDVTAFDEAGIKERLVKALVIKDLTEGKASTRAQLAAPLPIVFKRGEVLQWLFNNVTLREPRTNYHYEGGSHGISVRVLSGVSYRVGSHRGQRVSTTQIITVGSGSLAVSNKAVYFIGGPNSKKLTFSTIVSVDAYEDGTILTPSRGKQQLYLMPDAMFAANLILKAAAL